MPNLVLNALLQSNEATPGTQSSGAPASGAPAAGGDAAGTTSTTEAGAPSGETPGGPLQSITGFVPLILIFGIMYFVLIGPERKQRKKRDEMLKTLKKGDKVVTSSGLFGSIVAINETQVTLQVDEGVRLKFTRGAISDVVSDDAPSKTPVAAHDAAPAKNH